MRDFQINSILVLIALVALVVITASAHGMPEESPTTPRPDRTLGQKIVFVAEGVGKRRLGAPVTFGMFFARGDVPRTFVFKGNQTQVDVKRRWDDGSVKHAVVTVALPSMSAGERKELVSSPVENHKSGGHVPLSRVERIPNLRVILQVHKGPILTADLRQAIVAGPVRTWLAGELVTEYHFKIAPRGKDNRADPDLMVRFRVRFYPTSKSARVTVVVENTWFTSPGGIPYNVRILRGNKEIYACQNAGQWPGKQIPSRHRKLGYFGHGIGARWVKRFWIGPGPALDEIYPRYDRGYLNRTGLVPRYDLSIHGTQKDAARWIERWKHAPRRILQNGTITPFFGQSGGRADIGPLPLWTTLYLISQESWARSVTLGNGDLSGSCANHLRDPGTDWIVSLDDYPTFSFRNDGWYPPIRNKADTPYVTPHASYFILDAAHQPSLAYVPYLVTGDYYYLEELQWWANSNLLAAGLASREGEKGLLWSGQVRGVAWSLRALIHAASLSPDEGPGKPYFEGKLRNNLQWFTNFVEGKHPLYKPTDIGTYTPGAKSNFTERKWKTHKRTYLCMAGWMQNFLTWAVSYAVDHGYPEAISMRDYLMKFTVGIAANPKKIPSAANSAYYLLVGRNAKRPKDWELANSIAELNRLNFHRPKTEPKVEPSRKTNREYANAARGNIITAFRERCVPKAGQALRNINRIVGRDLDYRWAFEIPKPPGTKGDK